MTSDPSNTTSATATASMKERAPMMIFPSQERNSITVMGKPVRLIVLPQGHSATWPPALQALFNDPEGGLVGYFSAGEHSGGTCDLLELESARRIGLVDQHDVPTGALAGYPMEWGLSFTTRRGDQAGIYRLLNAVAGLATEGYQYLVHFHYGGLDVLTRLPAAEQSDPPTHTRLVVGRTRWTLAQHWRQEPGTAPTRVQTRTGEITQDAPPWSRLSLRHVPARDTAPCPLCDDGLSDAGDRPHIVLGENADALCRACAERFCPDLLRYRDILWVAL